MTSLATKPDAAPTGEVTTDPASLGFDPARLKRIDDHFARYVDSGRLPGWQLAITRGGTLDRPARMSNATSKVACESGYSMIFATPMCSPCSASNQLFEPTTTASGVIPITQ